jgi:hypothetical protein
VVGIQQATPNWVVMPGKHFNYFAGVDVNGLPQQKVTEIHLSMVGIQQDIPNWVVMPGNYLKLPHWG